ncbi:protein LSM14 homolog A-like isoform X5 [Penaeus monodon]|uniref:protein LSM14 homolog A-like isoform X5 n=1 Tax=Penaeus monodon TaxID=6687 RepID=UPI000F68B230|nr:protein LSM14 homolog A-like isoform X2 [Penaeus vannamei]XP_037800840.1 protein LSM14 homolog A-like isoform X5 [Penaeus monodon]
MSGPVPFLGSKISLISKSEIRYEGILYTIDAQESIIALAKVRSFGTEDRPTEMPVAARDEVYEYIIFRGTDIKKIEVCDTPKQPTLPGGLHNDPAIVQHSAPAVPSSFQAAPFSRQSLGPIGGGLGLSYGAYGQSMTQQGLPGTGGFPMGSTSQPSLLSDILVGSRSSTPTARKSPVSDAGVQVSPPPSREEKKKSPQQQRQSQQERPQRNGNQSGQGRRNQQQAQQQQPQQQQQQSQQNHHPNQQQQYHNNYQYHQYQGRGGMGRGRGMRRPGGQRGRGQIFNQGNRQRQIQDQQLFEKDYDFEQANEEFEELKNQLAKTKITENGEKKDDSGHETAGGEDVEDPTCYDKAKSFFDRISCESIERSKGKSQRPDWRLERKINVETFGVSSARRGFYPRGRGYYRGGYYRNYNYNQGYYRGGGGGGSYRGGRGGTRGNASSVNGMSQRGTGSSNGGGSAYVPAVRNSTPNK